MPTSSTQFTPDDERILMLEGVGVIFGIVAVAAIAGAVVRSLSNPPAAKETAGGRRSTRRHARSSRRTRKN